MNGVRGLSAQQVGVYMMLLCRIYEEDGTIEFHELRLATYCGMRQNTFKKTVEQLIELDKFQLVDGHLNNRRAETEISSRADNLKKKSKAGKASAQKTQQKQGQPPTPVEQVSNDTEEEEDTDTYISSSSSTRASFEQIRVRLKNATGRAVDWDALEISNLREPISWLDPQGDNAPLDLVCEAIGSRCSVMIAQDANLKPIKHWKYFTACVQDALTAHRNPLEAFHGTNSSHSAAHPSSGSVEQSRPNVRPIGNRGAAPSGLQSTLDIIDEVVAENREREQKQGGGGAG